MLIFKSNYSTYPLPQNGIIQTFFETKNQNKNMYRISYVDALTGKELTFKQIKNMAYRFGAGLQDVCGLEKGDTVAIYAF